MCCWHDHGHLHHGCFGYGPGYGYGPPYPYARRGRRRLTRDLEDYLDDLEDELAQVRRDLQDLREQGAEARQAPGAGEWAVRMSPGGPAAAGPACCGQAGSKRHRSCPSGGVGRARRCRGTAAPWFGAQRACVVGQRTSDAQGSGTARPGTNATVLAAVQRRALGGVPALDALAKAVGRLADAAAPPAGRDRW